MARAEDEVLEAVGPGDERVLHLVRPVDDAVEGPHLVHVAVLPGESRSGKDEEELLRGPVRMGRGRQLAGSDADTVDADALGAGSAAEPLPLRVHLPLGRAMELDLVPVRDGHRRQVCQDLGSVSSASAAAVPSAFWTTW